VDDIQKNDLCGFGATRCELLLERFPIPRKGLTNRNRANSESWSVSESNKSSNLFGTCSKAARPERGE
jgi:hypothetical protein